MMPSNRYGGSGRYFRNPSEGRGRNGPPPSHSHVKTEPKSNDAKLKQEVPSPKSQPPPVKRHQEQELVDKYKPIGANNSGVDAQGSTPKSAPPERKFTQRSRLFIGNLPPDMSEDEFKKLFKSFGEISETFVNPEKGFGFVRLDTRANAEKAKWELDGLNLKSRQLRVRFATHGAALSVKNISLHVSNELLEEAFSQFGQVERAVVIVDDRGRSTERGIVEFARKSSATKALQQIRDGCFLLTTSPRALVVNPLEQEDSEDGLPERNLQKGPAYFQERDSHPRFAQSGTFEEEFARRWKALDNLEKQERELLEKNILAAKEKLESEMENAIHEHRNLLMKQDLMRRQEELQRLEEARKRELDRRQQLELEHEEIRKKEAEEMQRRQEMLRAQIEGRFKSENVIGGYGRNMPRPGYGGGRPSSPPSQAMLHDVLSQEMMGGQGGLGPAPSRFDQTRPMMGGRGGHNPTMGPHVRMGGMNSGYGPSAGQRRGFEDLDFEAQKRRRY